MNHVDFTSSEKVSVMSHGSCAVFVKTPGLSPLKTRLAKTIGKKKAETFYRKSCAAIHSVLSTESPLKAYWAVAEPPDVAHSLWNTLQICHQGEGSLGERLHRVYQFLISKFDYAILLGADCPQIDAKLLSTTCKALEEYDFVCGPARDGGFYLFAGKKPVPQSIWTSVHYSQHNTLKQLKDELLPNQIYDLPKRLCDVDVFDDLDLIESEMKSLPHTTAEQSSLVKWVKNLKRSYAQKAF